MTNDHKAVFVSDVHIPYHDKRKLDLFFKVLKWFKPNSVDLVGDIDDACATSRWSDGTAEEALAALPTYIHLVHNFFDDIRKALPDADIHFHSGNHDIRHFDYIEKKAPAFHGLITPESLWKISDYGMVYHAYTAPPVKRFGDLYVHHGMSISKHAAESVRNDIDTFGVSLIRGHSHRLGSYYKTYELTGQKLRGWEIGHMTDINSEGMAYTNSKNWQSGFAIAHVYKDYPLVSLIEITDDYKAMVDGKLFSA